MANEISTLHNKLDIHVQHNLKLIVKQPSPLSAIDELKEYYECGSSNVAVNIIQSSYNELEASYIVRLEGDIPDAAAIDHVKKQRELAKRQIKTHSSSSDDDSVHPNFTKRVSTKPDHDLNPDDSEPIAMIGQNNTFEKDRQIARNAFLSVEHGSDRDSDQENEWESRQLQKAINKVALPLTNRDRDHRLFSQNIIPPKETKKIDWKIYANEDCESNIRSSVLFELNSISIDDLTVSKLTELLVKRWVLVDGVYR